MSLSTLPNELLIQIFGLVDRRDLINLGKLCRRFRQLTNPGIFSRLTMWLSLKENGIDRDFLFPAPSTENREIPPPLRSGPGSQSRRRQRVCPGCRNVPPKRVNPLLYVLACPFAFFFLIYRWVLRDFIRWSRRNLQRHRQTLRTHGKPILLKIFPRLLQNPSARSTVGYPIRFKYTKNADSIKRALSDRNIVENVFSHTKELAIGVDYLWGKGIITGTLIDFSAFVGRYFHSLLDAMENLQVIEAFVNLENQESIFATRAFFKTIESRKPTIKLKVFVIENNSYNQNDLGFLSRLSEFQVDGSRVSPANAARFEVFIAGVINRSPDLRYLNVSMPSASLDRILGRIELPSLNIRTLDVSKVEPPQMRDIIRRLAKVDELIAGRQGLPYGVLDVSRLRAMWFSMNLYLHGLRPRKITALLLEDGLMSLLSSSRSGNLRSLSLYIDEDHIQNGLTNLASNFWTSVMPSLSARLSHLTILPMYSHHGRPGHIDVCISLNQLHLFSASYFINGVFELENLESLRCYTVHLERWNNEIIRFTPKCPRLSNIELQAFDTEIEAPETCSRGFSERVVDARLKQLTKLELFVRVLGISGYGYGRSTAMTAMLHARFRRKNGSLVREF